MSARNPLRRFVLLSLALLCPLLAHAAPAPPARNLLVNPGFEKRLPEHEWMPAGWDTSDSGLPTVFFGRDTFLVHSGHYAVNIANTSTLYSMAHNWSQTLLVGREAWGKTAVFSAWTRSNGLQGRAFIILQAYRDTISRMAQVLGIDREEARRRLGINKVDDPAIDLGWKDQYFEDPQTGWVKREARIRIAPGTNVLFVRMGMLGTGQVIFDDASLALVPSANAAPVYATGANVLVDPGFEQGGLAWQWVIPPFEGARIERDSSVAHGGRMSMRCENMNDGLTSTRAGVAQVLSARGLEGKHVRISGWFKGDSLISTAYVKVYAHSQHGTKQSPGTQLLSGTFDWTEVSAEFDVPRDATELWAWLVFNAPCNGRIWIDDGALTVMGPAIGNAAAPARAPVAPAKKKAH